MASPKMLISCLNGNIYQGTTIHTCLIRTNLRSEIMIEQARNEMHERWKSVNPQKYTHSADPIFNTSIEFHLIDDDGMYHPWLQKNKCFKKETDFYKTCLQSFIDYAFPDMSPEDRYEELSKMTFDEQLEKFRWK